MVLLAPGGPYHRRSVAIVEAWRKRYKAVRPHSCIDYLTPDEFKLQHRSSPNHPTRAIPRNDRLEGPDSGHMGASWRLNAGSSGRNCSADARRWRQASVMICASPRVRNHSR